MGPPSSHTYIIATLLSLKVENKIFASVNYFTIEHNVLTQTGVRPTPSESNSLIMGPPSSHTNIIVTLLSLKVENQIFASVNYFTLEHNVITQTGVRPAPSESSSLIMGPPSSHTNIIAPIYCH